MDLTRLTRDADDLIRKVVSRYNQLYVPAGQISQLELDLMLDDMRKLYDTFKTIGQVSLTLQKSAGKPEVSVNTSVRSEAQHSGTATPLYEEEPAYQKPQAYEAKPDPAPAAAVPETRPQTAPPRPEPEPMTESKPETEHATHHEPDPAPSAFMATEKEPEAVTPSHSYEQPSRYSPAQAEAEPPVKENSFHAAAEKPTDAGLPDTQHGTLAEKFSTGYKSLSETMASSQSQGVLGSRLNYQPIGDLSTGIGLNDKYRFISELFGNDSSRYEEAITRINKAVNVDEASWILQKYHVAEWDQKEETLARLKEFVKRRFI
jgi:hypothetical protein